MTLHLDPAVFTFREDARFSGPESQEVVLLNGPFDGLRTAVEFPAGCARDVIEVPRNTRSVYHRLSPATNAFLWRTRSLLAYAKNPGLFSGPAEAVFCHFFTGPRGGWQGPVGRSHFSDSSLELSLPEHEGGFYAAQAMFYDSKHEQMAIVCIWIDNSRLGPKL
ncbi:hypothetical protein RSP_0080 [Pseudomonas phage RSP]|nr:hypothetical protein RSP_0080 [Pseudomonas phage RSP]